MARIGCQTRRKAGLSAEYPGVSWGARAYVSKASPGDLTSLPAQLVVVDLAPASLLRERP